MPIIPSNANRNKNESASSDAVEVARKRLAEALSPYFKGKTSAERLEKATNAAIAVIANLITIREVSGQKLGGTVMTEAASMRNEHTGEFNKKPRSL